MQFPSQMIKNEFEHEFRNRFRDSSLMISPTANGKDFVISNDKTSRAILVRTIEPIPEEEPKNCLQPDAQLDAEVVECYRFKMDDSVYPPDLYVFTFNNLYQITVNFLMIGRDELTSRLASLNEKPDQQGFYHLILWVLPENYVFAANNMTAGEEWYLMGSGCRQHFERDFSEYLDNWQIF